MTYTEPLYISFSKNGILYDSDGIEIGKVENIKGKYLALFCLQNYNLMASAKNAQTIEELLEEYWNYKEIDFEEEDNIDYYKSLSTEEQLDFVFADDLEIAISDEEFDTYFE